MPSGPARGRPLLRNFLWGRGQYQRPVGPIRSHARALAALLLLAACGGGPAASPALAAGSYDVKVVTSELCEDGKDGWTISGHIVPKPGPSNASNYYEGAGTYSGNMLQQGALGTPQSSSRQLHAISGGALITGTVVDSKLNVLGVLNEFPLRTFGGTVPAVGGSGVDHDHIGRTSPNQGGNAGPGCDVTWNLTVTKKA